jgi:hypothetical protein
MRPLVPFNSLVIRIHQRAVVPYVSAVGPAAAAAAAASTAAAAQGLVHYQQRVRERLAGEEDVASVYRVHHWYKMTKQSGNEWSGPAAAAAAAAVEAIVRRRVNIPVGLEAHARQ